jgi:[CysO sulfur-carrier protein]-S-L-cysteine hydrolase
VRSASSERASFGNLVLCYSLRKTSSARTRYAEPVADWASTAPWVNGKLRITRVALAELERAVQRACAEDEEACGVMCGPTSEPLLCDHVLPIQNLARSLHEQDPVRFFHTPRTFFAFRARTLERHMAEALARGSAVKVLYHSHLDSPALLSTTDAAVLSGGTGPAFEGGPATLGPGPAWPLAFLISHVCTTSSPPLIGEHRLFTWRDGGFHASSFHVT